MSSAPEPTADELQKLLEPHTPIPADLRLSYQQAHDLAPMAHAGHHQALALLVRNYWPLFLKVARRCAPQEDATQQDLMAEFCSLLRVALKGFDPQKSSLYQHLKVLITRRAPGILRKLRSPVNMGTNPANLTATAVPFPTASAVPFHTASASETDTHHNPDADAERDPQPSALDVLIEAEERHQLFQSINRLTPDEQFVIRSVFGMGGQPPKSITWCGLKLRVTHTKALEIQASALMKLKQYLEDIEDEEEL